MNRKMYVYIYIYILYNSDSIYFRMAVHLKSERPTGIRRSSPVKRSWSPGPPKSLGMHASSRSAARLRSTFRKKYMGVSKNWSPVLGPLGIRVYICIRMHMYTCHWFGSILRALEFWKLPREPWSKRLKAIV